MNKKQIINFLVTIFVICGILIFQTFFSDINNSIKKGFSNINGQQTPDTNIVIIHVSPSDIINLGDWPLKRSYYALLINNLTELNVRKIGLEIFLSEKNTAQNVYNNVLVNSIIKSGKVVLSSIAEDINLIDDKYSAGEIIYSGLKNENAKLLTGHINYISSDGIIIPFEISNESM